MAVIDDIRIKQDWTPDGYVSEHGLEDKPEPVSSNPAYVRAVEADGYFMEAALGLAEDSKEAALAEASDYLQKRAEWVRNYMNQQYAKDFSALRECWWNSCGEIHLEGEPKLVPMPEPLSVKEMVTRMRDEQRGYSYFIDTPVLRETDDG